MKLKDLSSEVKRFTNIQLFNYEKFMHSTDGKKAFVANVPIKKAVENDLLNKVNLVFLEYCPLLNYKDIDGNLVKEKETITFAIDASETQIKKLINSL